MHKLTVNLELRPAEPDERKADAWFVPGATATSWVAAVTQPGCATESVRLRIVSDNKGNSIGAVVTGIDLSARRSCLPYSRVADHVFVPTASCFYPHVSPDEIRHHLNSEAISEYVWHPTVGLVGFERDQILRIDQLLTSAPARSSDWQFAQPGDFVNDRLHTVSPIESLSLESILADGRDDIGQDADKIDDLPRSSDETMLPGVQDLAGKMMTPMAKLIRWLAAQASPTASSPTWVNSVDDWASRLLANASISNSRRMNELKRLLSMLDHDPDRGLRHALPFGGDAGRGVAQPTNWLGNRSIEYGASGGSGPADYWDIPYKVRQALQKRYRELAQREVKLGRYRRAAYIYATLLDDVSAAGQVLEDGGFFLEAAEVYKERLNNLRRAARCLRRGGLWAEAVELYERMNNWAIVAEIHQELGNHAAATAAWKEAAASRLRDKNFIGAADIQERRLSDVAAAETLLERGWIHAGKPREHLEGLFGLHRRHENHAAAVKLLERAVNTDDRHSTPMCDVAEVLAKLSHDYPAANVRSDALKKSRRLVADNLGVTDKRDRRRFLAVLESFNPDDRLLKRDCQRFERQAPSRPQARTKSGLRHQDRILLRSDVRWKTATRTSKRYFVAGKANDSLVVASWMPAGKPLITYNEFYLLDGEDQEILMAPIPGKSHSVYLHVTNLPENGLKDLSERFSGSFCRSLPHAHTAVAAVGVSAAGSVWTLNATANGVALSCCGDNGVLIGDYELPFSPSTAASMVLVHVFRDRRIICAMEKLIAIGDARSAGVRFDTLTFDITCPARQLTGFDDAKSSRFAILFDEGGVVGWLNTGNQQPFAAGLASPVAAFMGNGDLIVIDDHGTMEVYQTRGERIHLIAAHSHNIRHAVSVLPCSPNETDAANAFLTCHTDGTIDLFESYT